MFKKLIYLSLYLVPALGFSQNFTVKGKIGNFNAPAKAYLSYSSGGKGVTDSVVLVNGTFEFKGTVADPSQANLFVNPLGNGIHAPYDYTDFYIDKGATLITSADFAKNATVSGTKVSEDNTRYQAALKVVNDEYAAIEARQQAATPEKQSSPEFQKEIDALNKIADKHENAITKKFIQDNPSSPVSLNALRNFTYSADYGDVEPLFHHLNADVQNSSSGKKYAVVLEKLKGVAYGKTAPDFAQPDTSGKMVRLSSFRGKYVLVDFWASWCGPCRQENPNVVKAFNQFKDKNFTILSVSLDRPGAKEKWMKAIHKDGLTWTHVSDLKFWQNEAAQLYGVQAIPQNFLLDPSGKIIGKNLRGEDLAAKLTEIYLTKKNDKTE